MIARVLLPGIGWRTISRYARCRRCHRFKSRPASVCGQCGDDPVTYRGDRFEYDRAHGWEDYPLNGYPEGQICQ